MTLIAYTVTKNGTELLTDTLSYSQGFEEFGHSTKFDYLAHLDLLVTTQGLCEFGRNLRYVIDDLAGDAPDLDALVATLIESEALLQVWASCDGANGRDIASAHLIGYSPEAEGFRAVQFHAEHGFRPEVVAAGVTQVTPAPWDARPEAIEAERIRNALASAGWGAAKVEDLIGRWEAMAPTTAPKGIDEWRNLGKHIRETRALEKFMKTAVAGDLMLTKVTRGAMSTQRIHRFNDSGDEFLRLVEGTYHPLALNALDQASA